ncbi:MAG: hypothetical protein KBB71_00435 [Lentimicrobiaceae bacterium]|nr:hypothetical protein [Lentimicrobiaceae bacterium]
MKSQPVLAGFCLVISLVTAGQNQPIDLTFTAVDNLNHVQLDSIKVINRTQGIQTTICWPDTMITIEITPGDLLLYLGYGTKHYVAIPENNQETSSFQLFQNYPNPVRDQTEISMYLPGKGQVHILVSDLQGRVILSSDWQLTRGNHSFRFMTGHNNFLILTAKWNGMSRSIKIVSSGQSNRKICSLDYTGSDQGNGIVAKASSQTRRGTVYESGILDTPDTHTTYTFQFASRIPCPGTPTVEYQGQLYHTIQIFSQCWMKENLNAGTMIASMGPGQLQTDNGYIEKYCYANEAAYCNAFGGLYEWDEAMQYADGEGAQGICPEGWHIPTDEEWKLLEGIADSHFPPGDPVWDLFGFQGTDAGGNLKETGTGYWEYPNEGATNSTGFSGLPGSYRYGYESGYFGMEGADGCFWTSSSFSPENAYTHYLRYDDAGSGRNDQPRVFGHSVRCLRNVVYSPYTLDLTFTAVNHTANIPLDSIRIMNRTQGKEITLLWPDTVLTLQTDLPYVVGDELLYIGYSGTLESGKLGKPEVSETVTLQFATNIPCPGTPVVYYEGRMYNTVQIFSQCWLKENLNAGTMIAGTQEMTDNDLLEKYCYNNDTYNCAQFGGLYTWDEMMKYESQQGLQGICPPDWHVPSDDEWKLLEGASDSLFGIGDPEWDGEFYRGFDAGINLKTTSGWEDEGNGADLYGFAGYPGGSHNHDGTFSGAGSYGHWMTSSEISNDHAWLRTLGHLESKSSREPGFRETAFNMRCIRNDDYHEVFQLTFTAVNNAEYAQLDQVKITNLSQDGSTVLTWPDTTLLLEYELPYIMGDQLLLVGYTGDQESGIMIQYDIPDTVVFQFATNIPCPGTPTVFYGSRTYNTVQIFSQCWFKENLNYGTMVLSNLDMTDNGYVERYCYGNVPANCDTYGGLYQWDEAMQYILQEGARGICPNNWHIPTHSDWMILSGATDSQYGIGEMIWEISGPNGFDAGLNLKATSGWNGEGNGLDLYGFSGLAGGAFYGYPGFHFINEYGTWWSSQPSSYYYTNCRELHYDDPLITKTIYEIDRGISVRCIRDY